MKEFIWLLPILVPIALVLGACRAERMREILGGSARSFGKLVFGMVVLAIALEAVLFAVEQIM